MFAAVKLCNRIEREKWVARMDVLYETIRKGLAGFSGFSGFSWVQLGWIQNIEQKKEEINSVCSAFSAHFASLVYSGARLRSDRSRSFVYPPSVHEYLDMGGLLCTRMELYILGKS